MGARPGGAAVTPDGSKAYVTNTGTNNVSVISTGPNNVIATIPVGNGPQGVAVTPDSSTVYVGNQTDNTVSVISTASNSVVGGPIPVGANPVGLAASPDGSKIYVANFGSNSVTVIATGSNAVLANISVGNQPQSLAVSPDGTKLYVANSAGSSVSVVSTASNTVTASIGLGSAAFGVAVTPDGSKLYATITGGVVAINTATNGQIASVPIGGSPAGVAATPDGSKVYVANFGGGNNNVGTVVVLSTATNGVITVVPVGFGPIALGQFIVPAPFPTTLTVTVNGSGTVTSNPGGINCPGTCASMFPKATQVTLTPAAASGFSFNGWSGGGCTGTGPCTLTLSGSTSVTANFTSTVNLFSAILPLSRSVQVGTAATAFATIINAGPQNGTGCSIAPVTSVPANFVYQTTDPTTNAVTGSANTPVNITAGLSQSFVIALTPTAPFAPTDVSFNFVCSNSPAAMNLTGINTLNLSGSATPVPDIVALAANQDPGYLDISPFTSTGAFAVATVNFGAASPITATADTGAATLPVSFQLCQTTSSGACMAPPAAAVTAQVANNATPTFAVFGIGTGTIPDLPGQNRAFVRFKDAGGTLRGATSVALRSR